MTNLATLLAFEVLSLDEADIWQDQLPEEPDALRAADSVKHEDTEKADSKDEEGFKEESSTKSLRFWVKTGTSFES